MITYKEVFQLAQDKGYRLRKARTISNDGTIKISDYAWGDEDEVKNHIRFEEILEDSLIELILIQRWLREKYKIDITITIRFAETYGVFIHKDRVVQREEIIIDVTYENHKHLYEYALLTGVQEGLKLLG